jgi:hypothetical protein
MSDSKQHQELVELHSEGKRMQYLLAYMHGLTWAILGVLAMSWATDPTIQFGGLLLGVGGFGIMVLMMLKVESKDGNKWASQIGNFIPKWRTPLPRNENTLDDIQNRKETTTMADMMEDD